MVVGIPNVGKSTFINKVAKKKSAKASDRPGVTRGKQWITVDQGLELLDTPGILWPKFEDETIGLHLAFTGAVRDAIMDVETLACHLMELLAQRKPEALTARFKIVPEAGMSGWDLLEAGGRKRGFLISGGEVDLERMANILLDEFRGGKLGRITLELPQDLEGRPTMARRLLTCGSWKATSTPKGTAPFAGWTRPGPAPWPAGSMPPR